MTDKSRGIIFLIAGVVFPVMLLFGGGVVKSSGHLTGVFLAVFVLGMAIIGPLIFRSMRSRAPAEQQKKPSLTWRVLSSLFVVLFVFLVNRFFESRFFSSGLGQHLFIIVTALALSIFIPLGLYHLRARQTRGSIPEQDTDPQ